MVKFDATKFETFLIGKIVDRVYRSFPNWPGDNRITLEMDITACHCNGMDLDLKGLLRSKELDFMHDIVGITKHIDRETGKMTDFFVPRYHLSNAKIVALAMTVADKMMKREKKK